MAKNLSNNGIVLNQTIYPQHVSQSVDAFTGADAYDITVSGSFTVTGSTAIKGDVNVDGPITMYGNVVAPNLTSTAQSNVVTFNPINGQLYYTASNAISPATASNAVSASYSATASYAEYAVSASYATTASWAINAITASYVTTAQTASYVLNAVSASYASTASYVANAQTASYVENAQTASYVTTAQTASYVTLAQTASYVTTSQTASYYDETDPVFVAKSASLATTGSNTFSGSQDISGSIHQQGVFYPDVIDWFSSSIQYTTGSYVLTTTSDGVTTYANYQDVATQLGDYLVTTTSFNSYTGSNTSQFAGTASYATTASYAVSSSAADSAISASYSTTASFAQNTPSASTAVSASHADLADTASYVTLAQTASYVTTAQTASYVTLAQTASYVLSASYSTTSSYSNNSTTASYALTASYLEGYISPFPFTGSAQITGSLGVTGSATINGDLVVNGTASFNVFHTIYNSSSIIYASGSTKFGDTSDDTHEFTGSLLVSGSVTADSFTGTASYATQAATASFVTLAQTASYVANAQTASYVANAQTASYVLNAVSSSFATTASYVANAQTASFVTLAQTASYVATASYSNSSLSASYALTASHVTGIVAAFPYTGSAQITGSLSVTGSVNIYKSGSTVLAVSGSTGPLMSITDSISGPLLTVSTGSTNILVVDSSLVTTITGSLNVQSGITGSLFGTASWALNSTTSSFVTTAQTASYVVLAQTASYVANAQTASFVTTAQTASYVLNAVSASYVATASYVTLAQTASYVTLAQTASYVLNAVSASYVTTASYALNAMSASYAVTASYATSALSSSYAATSSLSERTTQTDILVINQTGFTIEKGIVVRITGSNNSSDTPRITTASYESDPVSANTLGIATQQITNGSQGFAITEGILLGIDTSLYTSGQLLYLGANGAITGSAPLAPLHAVRLGQVIRQHAINGSMHVRIDNGYEIGELHNIIDNTTTSSYGDLLVKSGSVWVNSKQLTGSYGVTGSISATSFTGSLFGTSSYATQAATASYIVLAQTASFVTTAQTASYVLNAVSSSFASTASYVNQLNQTVNISGSLFATGSVNIYKSGSSPLVISGSQGTLFEVTDSVSGSLWTIYTGSSPIFDVSSNRVMTLSGSAVITGSLTVQNGITGSLFGTASTASYVVLAQTASYVLNAVSSSFASTASFVALAQTASYVVLAQTASYVLNAVSSSFAATASYVNQLNQTVNISGSINATGSVSVYKSGSTVFAVSGSAGPLFDVSDVVSGSLFTVWTGSNRILQANSDYTTILGGASGAAALFATNKTTANSGSTTLYTVPTATYDSIHIDYNIRSGSVGRAGNLFAMWSGSSVNQIETSASSFGDTSGFTFGVIVSGSNLALTGSVSTSGWTVKTIIRSI